MAAGENNKKKEIQGEKMKMGKKRKISLKKTRKKCRIGL